IVDGKRRHGNGLLLPAGPLREPVSRLKKVDLIVVVNGCRDENSMYLEPMELVSVHDERQTKPITAFNHQPVDAVAGIGDPERFFQQLEQLGMMVERHIYPDHYVYKAS